MEKDKTILEFIEKLKLKVNTELFEIIDYWDADLCAIGLKKGNRLIYLSTYNYILEDIIKYDFHFEIIDKLQKDKIQILKEGRAVSEDEIFCEVRAFLAV